MSEQSIGDILNGDETTVTDAGDQGDAALAIVDAGDAGIAPEPAPADDQGGTPAQPRGPDGKFIPKGEAQSAPPAPQDEPGNIPIAALKDERSKRQELERKLAELEARLSQPAPQPVPQDEGPPDRWEDPEGYDRWLVAQATSRASEAAQQQFAVQRIQMSAEEAKAKYPDYLEKKSVFEQMAQNTPMLLQEMMRHPNPAQYAYEVAKTQLELQQYGGLEGLIEARIAEREAQAMQNVQQQLPSAPPTISGDRSVAPRSGPAWAGPTPIGDILS